MSLAATAVHQPPFPARSASFSHSPPLSIVQAHTADIVAKGDKAASTTEMTDAICEELTKVELRLVFERGSLVDGRTACLCSSSTPPFPSQVLGKPRPMTLSEKILCQHAIGLSKPEVKPGDFISVKVQWTLASEITWKGMEKTYDLMGRCVCDGGQRRRLFFVHPCADNPPRLNHQPGRVSQRPLLAGNRPHGGPPHQRPGQLPCVPLCPYAPLHGHLFTPFNASHGRLPGSSTFTPTLSPSRAA